MKPNDAAFPLPHHNFQDRGGRIWWWMARPFGGAESKEG